VADQARISIAAVHELFSDPHGPVGELMDELAAAGANLARELVPRDSGRMTETITSGTDRDPFDQTVRAWFGAGYDADVPAGRPWVSGFPVINALEAKHHYVWNRSPRNQKHTRGVRRTEPFVTEALDLLRV
jgi:hypothetical protein